ncbi:MAG: DUF3052 domain-containing protein [Chloroflexota bacterium]|nr:DUF3052 domain-containing protein [Chloroflexota bacterium]MDE2886012.1 DUF3052 domain-containing protein [Chloroflexota bacterium]
MAGYSGTPLPRKLGIKAGATLAIEGAPAGFDATLGELPDGVTRADDGEAGVDVLLAFHVSRHALESMFIDQACRIAPDGGYWIAWPKRASGVPTDITEDVLREVILPAGLVDNKVCAIDDTWSGLRFVVRKERRAVWPAI